MPVRTLSLTRLSVLVVAWFACAPAVAGADGRYLAVFADGRRVTGDDLSGWGQDPAAPQLAGESLADPRRPLRWFLDTELGLWRASKCTSGYVEFVGGDRLVGHVVGSGQDAAGGSGGGFLSVVPAYAREVSGITDAKVVRVSREFIRRIVWTPQPHRALSPATILLRNGGRVRYKSIRWLEGGVSVLLAKGVRKIGFAEIAELHTPVKDSWKGYLRELSILNPDRGELLFRLETSDGFVLTSCPSRFRAAAVSDRKLKKKGPPQAVPGCWRHMVQPAWSADPIWLRFDAIVTRSFFPAHRPPLSRLSPDNVVQKSMTGFSWRWRADRNVQGDRMIVAGRAVSGGLGVHANNELTYSLPDFVRAFRTRVALDSAAGDGGCVRGAVYLDSTRNKPLYRSDLIVGSGSVYDSGRLSIPPGKDRRLILVADAAHADRPEGADPLDIRDTLNWIDPVLELDEPRLRAAAADLVLRSVDAWRDWDIALDGGDGAISSRWIASSSAHAGVENAMSTKGRRLTLATRRRVGSGQRYLKIQVRQVGPACNAGRIEVRTDGRLAAYLPVRRAGFDAPYLIPLESLQGKDVNLQIVYRPGAADETIDWPTLSLVESDIPAGWSPLRIVSAYSQRGVKLSVLNDGSILAACDDEDLQPYLDTYCIRAATDLPLVGAIRLEALADPSLRRGGPGRSGRAVLSQFRASSAPTRRRVFRGRYVKLSLPDRETHLHVNEVQVFAPPPSEAQLLTGLGAETVPENMVSKDHKSSDVLAILKTPERKRSIDQRTLLRSYLDAISPNVALGAAATQSSEYVHTSAKNAVDGRIFSGYTHTGKEMSPWLLVDLGRICEIDRIVVWNREDGNGYERMNDLLVEVLDADRKSVWRRVLKDSSAPAAELFDSDAAKLTFSSAAASFNEPDSHPPAHSLDSTVYGWTISSRVGESHAAEFVIDRPVDLRRTGLDFKLRQAYSFYYPMSPFSDGRDRLHRSNTDRIATLGRFRLLASSAPAAGPVEPPPIVIVPYDTWGSEKADPSVALTSPHPLFEDSGRFTAVDRADRSKVRLVSDDRHAGKRAVRIESGGEYRLNLGRVISIGPNPAAGEFRYIRFAFRKYGGGRVSLSLGHLNSHQRRCRYEAGSGAPSGPDAQSVWSVGLPPEWIVLDRDILGDFGRMDLTSLSFACSGGGHAVLDHVYLAAKYDDFKRLPAAPSLEETNLKARRVLAGPILKKGFPAFVSVTVSGQTAGGAIVGDEGWVLTVGHILAGGQKDASIRLRDGRTVRGKIAGIYRNSDVGLVKIIDKGPWKGLELSRADTLPRGDLYVGFTFARSFKGGKTPTSYITDITETGYWTYRGKYALKDAIVGGVLLDSKARIVGIHNQVVNGSVLQYSKMRSPMHEWRKLQRGDIWSKWLTGSGPMLGFHSAIRNGGCGVATVYPNTPAAAAGMKPGDLITQINGESIGNFEGLVKALGYKDPGQEVSVTYKRGKQTIRKKIRLMRRKQY